MAFGKFAECWWISPPGRSAKLGRASSASQKKQLAVPAWSTTSMKWRAHLRNRALTALTSSASLIHRRPKPASMARLLSSARGRGSSKSLGSQANAGSPGLGFKQKRFLARHHASLSAFFPRLLGLIVYVSNQEFAAGIAPPPISISFCRSSLCPRPHLRDQHFLMRGEGKFAFEVALP